MDEKTLAGLVEVQDRLEALGEHVQALEEDIGDFQVRQTMRQLEIMAKLKTISDHLGVVDDAKTGDELLADATQAVINGGLASISYLQHKLDAGHARAAQLIELLEKQGLIGDDAPARKVIRIVTEPDS